MAPCRTTPKWVSWRSDSWSLMRQTVRGPHGSHTVAGPTPDDLVDTLGGFYRDLAGFGFLDLRQFHT
jgi:hypothetical protein